MNENSLNRYHKAQLALLSIAAVVAALWLLRETVILTMPLAVAFVLAVIVRPVHRVLENRLPRPFKWVGLVAAAAVMLGMVVAAIAIISLVVIQFQQKVPKYAAAFNQMWEATSNWLWEHDLNVGGREMSTKALTEIPLALAALVPSLLEGLGLLTLILFFALIMLVEMNQWKRKSRQATGDARLVAALRITGIKIRRYMLSRTLIGLGEAVAQGLFLWLVGVDFWYLWALLFFLLSYIPNLGPFIALFPPAIITLIQMGPWWMLLVLGVLIVIDQIAGNYVAPVIQGKEQGVSTLMMLVCVIFWGWVWGVPGAVIAVPLTVTLITLCSLSDSLRPIALLLSRSAADLPVIE